MKLQVEITRIAITADQEKDESGAHGTFDISILLRGFNHRALEKIFPMAQQVAQAVYESVEEGFRQELLKKSGEVESVTREDVEDCDTTISSEITYPGYRGNLAYDISGKFKVDAAVEGLSPEQYAYAACDFVALPTAEHLVVAIAEQCLRGNQFTLRGGNLQFDLELKYK